jgi:F0F1-type ATP synthase delta subunit
VNAIKKSLNVDKDAPVTVIQEESVIGGVQARYGDTVLEASVPSLFTQWKATL